MRLADVGADQSELSGADGSLPADINLELVRMLGEGQFGCVYEGLVRTSARRVAVKVIRDGSERVCQLAVNEAMIGARIRHPNIVRVFDLRRAGPYWVVVMELIDGRSLDQSADLHETTRLAAPRLKAALQWLLESRIVLRDIKPCNIVIRPDGTPVLVDLGLAIDLDLHDPAKAGIAGTPWYMPPEAMLGVVHPGFDCYSFGVTLAVGLTGTNPSRAGIFPGGLDGLIQAKRDGRFLKWLHEVLSPLPADWTKSILQLTHDAPEQRMEALTGSCPPMA